MTMNRALTFAKRNRKEILRDYLSLIFLFAFPILMLVLFYLIFHSRASQFERQYLAPSRIGFSHAFLSLLLARLISSDRDTAFINRLYTTPLKPAEFILGYALSVLPLGFVQSLSVSLIGGCFQASLFSVNRNFLLSSVLSEVLFIGLGILFGSLFPPKAVGGVCSVLIAGQSILSGRWFPQEGLSKSFVLFRKCLPFKNIADRLRNIARGCSDLWQGIFLPRLILFAYRVLSFVFGIFTFRLQTKEK